MVAASSLSALQACFLNSRRFIGCDVRSLADIDRNLGFAGVRLPFAGERLHVARTIDAVVDDPRLFYLAFSGRPNALPNRHGILLRHHSRHAEISPSADPKMSPTLIFPAIHPAVR